MINNFTSLFSKKLFRTGALLLVSLVGLFSLNGCKKEESDTNTYSALAVYNASPTVSTYDIYLGGTKFNSVAIPFGGGVAYSQQISGTYDLKFSIAGRSESAFTKSVVLPQSNYCTFFLVGKANAFDGFLVNDDLNATSTTNAFVRFVNVSPDAPALDLYVKGGAAVSSKINYKSASGFVQLAAGSYTFEVKDNANGTVKTSTEAMTLGANIYYTVMVKGVVTPSATELPLSAQVIAIK